MTIKDWPADDYAIGAYIQATVANMYLKHFKPKANARVLDIGCGDGSFSTTLLKLIPEGHMLGIDASENMLSLAREKARQFNNFAVQKSDVLTMTFTNEFDVVVSFWCLQWTDDITKAFSHIYQALKPGGNVFTLFPSGDDPFMLSYQAVRDSGQFKELNHFDPPMHYSALENLAEKLKKTPFSKLKVDRTAHSIELPNLDTFRRFVYGIGFYQGYFSPEKIVEINEAMINWYDAYCQSEFNGKFCFQFSPYWVTGEK
ncbi:trans-aconitate 2-methyltransferase [Legionella sp. W05-934-2]|jgi:ubiquinone/menaquinone biosynthesis C-methylase UbiE|uniref:trans-aconitate 2-methyltransferase n=1 Tax=Legionella sp. W05-934-2 TaxID=1198649 RepID=UPI003462C226